MDIGEYHVDLQTSLGEGSYGIVYKGSLKTDGSPVAIKKIEIADHLDKSTLQEIHSLMSVKHNNIVQLLNVFEDDVCWWIVLEYCEQDLEKYLRSSNPDFRRKLVIMQQCASGISYLHNMKEPIVHRDIKLKNILLHYDLDNTPVVKICDFGLSRNIKSQQEIMTSDRGTLAFLAPEFFAKIDGKLQYTASVDTFALGLVFKVLLDYRCGSQNFYPTVADIEGEESWMMTYGMTLAACKKNSRKRPVLFLVHSDESDRMMRLKSLIISMTAVESSDRPEMETVLTFLTQLRHISNCNAVAENIMRLQKHLERQEEELTDLQTSIALDQKKNEIEAIVCGIHLGSTYTTCGFSFRCNPEDVKCMNSSTGDMYHGLQNITKILIGPLDEPICFGYQAEHRYAELLNKENHEGYHLFPNPIPLLMNRDVNINTQMEATDGYKLSVKSIVAFAIKFMITAFLQMLSERRRGSYLDNIQWVIVTPVPLHFPGITLLKHAAVKAGCPDTKLLFVEEASAATAWANEAVKNRHTSESTIRHLPIGIKYLYINIDDVTSIAAHEVLNKHCTRQLIEPTEIHFGAATISQNFENLMRKIFGNHFINVLKSECQTIWNKMTDVWLLYSTKNTEKVNIEIPYMFFELSKTYTGRNIHDVINSYSDERVSFKHGKLCISQACTMELTAPTKEGVIASVKSSLQDVKLDQVSAVILAGGFSEWLESDLKKNVSEQGIQVILPIEPKAAAVKGAVLFGHNSKLTSKYIMAHAYGVSIEPEFDVSIHSVFKKKTKRFGKEYCADVFWPFVIGGESKMCGEKISKTLQMNHQNQQLVSLGIFRTYRSVLDDVEYVDSNHFQKVGSLTLFIPQTVCVTGREVLVEFLFAGTEFWVSAKHLGSGIAGETTVRTE